MFPRRHRSVALMLVDNRLAVLEVASAAGSIAPGTRARGLAGHKLASAAALRHPRPDFSPNESQNCRVHGVSLDPDNCLPEVLLRAASDFTDSPARFPLLNEPKHFRRSNATGAGSTQTPFRGFHPRSKSVPQLIQYLGPSG